MMIKISFIGTLQSSKVNSKGNLLIAAKSQRVVRTQTEKTVQEKTDVLCVIPKGQFNPEIKCKLKEGLKMIVTGKPFHPKDEHGAILETWGIMVETLDF